MNFKTTAFLATAAVIAITGPACAEDAFKSDKDKTSYAIGLDIAQGMKRSGIEINGDMVAKGLVDGMNNKPLITDEEAQKVLQALQEDVRSKRAAAQEKASKENKDSGEKFLAENKTKEGVKTTPSGLQYKVISEGKGEKPKKTDTVTVNYRGTLINGTEFDSSYKRSEPVTFALDQVIPGWTEGLQLMNAGSKYQFFIPASLAYAENGPPGIGPNQTLIFEVELLKFEKGGEQPAKAEETPAAKEEKPAAKPASKGAKGNK